MADDEQSLSDDEQSFLLSGTSSLEGVDFCSASGINVGNFARTIVGTLGLALGTAATIFAQGVTEAWTRLIDGVTDFLAGGRQLVTGVASDLVPGPVYRDVPGLIGTLSDGITDAIRETWTSTLPDSGIATWLVGLGLVLLTFYAAARGFDEVSEAIRE